MLVATDKIDLVDKKHYYSYLNININLYIMLSIDI